MWDFAFREELSGRSSRYRPSSLELAASDSTENPAAGTAIGGYKSLRALAIEVYLGLRLTGTYLPTLLSPVAERACARKRERERGQSFSR